MRIWFALAVVLGACSGGLLWVARAAAQGRLRRNRFAGIRTRETLANEDAWIAAHMMAERRFVWAGLGGVTGSLVLLFLRTRDGLTIALITVVTSAILVAGAALGWAKGARAVRQPYEPGRST